MTQLVSRTNRMKLAYLDCSSGISGDMFLGACLDSGLDSAALLAELAKLKLGSYEFKPERVLRAGLAGTHVEIVAAQEQPPPTSGLDRADD